MAKPIMILGKSGTGKSSSVRTLNPLETFVIKPNTKEFGFPGSAKTYTPFDRATGKGNVIELKDLKELRGTIQFVNKAPHIKNLIIEDLSHFYTKRILSDDFAADEGYGKWNTFGRDVFNSIFTDLTTFRQDLQIIVIQHTEIRKDGSIADKTSGKMIENTIDMPSWFTVVLHALTIDVEGVTRYVFQTNKSGPYLAKSPAGMFKDLYVRNDLAEVLKAQEDYYNGNPQGEVVFL